MMARLCWTTNGTSSPVSTQTASLHSTFSSMSGITGVSKTVYISAKTVGGTKIDTTLEGPDFLQSWRPSTTPPFQFTGFYPIHRSHSGLRPTTYSGSQTTELICWQSDFAVLLAADTATLATRVRFGKLFYVATHVAFGEKRCRKNLPLCAAGGL